MLGYKDVNCSQCNNPVILSCLEAVEPPNQFFYYCVHCGAINKVMIRNAVYLEKPQASEELIIQPLKSQIKVSYYHKEKFERIAQAHIDIGLEPISDVFRVKNLNSEATGSERLLHCMDFKIPE